MKHWYSEVALAIVVHLLKMVHYLRVIGRTVIKVVYIPIEVVVISVQITG